MRHVAIRPCYRDNSRYAQARPVTQPATAPAYFRGRPATFWLAIFRKPKSR
jgi:hypothetical protein